MVAVDVLETATRGKKRERPDEEGRKDEADGTAPLNSSGTSGTGTIKGSEIGTATITDSGYASSFLGFTGNGGDTCVLGGGVITITTKDGSTLNLVRSGMDCDISGDGIIG